VQYDTLMGTLKVGDLDRPSTWVAEGNIKPVVGRTAELSDSQAVKDGCTIVNQGKEGWGSLSSRLTRNRNSVPG
jgi:hypothetical protein